MKLLAALLLSVVIAAPAYAQGRRGPSCEDLWVARNQIYKDAGYCFKTQRAIRYFGNRGCRYRDMGAVPLSRAERREIADIQRRERFARCPR
ncbi:MAG: YARHG domain-containing protein [Methylobacteriaceae bacterium]|jgi:hypothetical protein|nr:YARHG domain-containing protein [Methylobacteriaceae bacterium]